MAYHLTIVNLNYKGCTQDGLYLSKIHYGHYIPSFEYHSFKLTQPCVLSINLKCFGIIWECSFFIRYGFYIKYYKRPSPDFFIYNFTQKNSKTAHLKCFIYARTNLTRCLLLFIFLMLGTYLRYFLSKPSRRKSHLSKRS